MLALGLRQVIQADYRRRYLPLSTHIARLREQAKRDRQEVEGLWIIWSHAPDETKAALYLRNIRELQRAAATKEERADHWERELVRRAEAAHRSRSPRKANDIKDLTSPVRK